MEPKEPKLPIFPTPKAINVVDTVNMKITPFNLNLLIQENYIKNF
jgi:hypothetical protein